jgi:hypothetical protein
MPHFHFHIRENGRLIRDDEGQEFEDVELARKEAIATGASIARDVFIAGSARRVIVDVCEGDTLFLKVSITMDLEE